MRISLLGILGFVLIYGCSNQEQNNSLLSQPPYDKITDSIKVTPGDAGLYYRRGSMLYKNNEKSRAENDLKKAWELQPNEDHALGVATVLKEKNTDSAIVFLQQALSKLQGSIALNIALARGFQQKNEPEKALEICRSINRQYPNELDALTLQAELLKDLQRNDEALAMEEKAYAFAPQDPSIAYDLAYDYAAVGNKKALYLCDSLIKHDASALVARAYYVKGIYMEHTGRPRESLLLFDEAIRHNYNFLDGYLDKGRLQYQLKLYTDALKTFDLGLKVSPTTADFYLWEAKIYEAQNKKNEAKLNYERAYGLDKTLEEAKAGMQRLP